MIKKQYDGIQALRFVAAITIVIYHLSLHYLGRKGTIDVSVMKYFGYLGVDVFFVISGFVIWHSTSEKTEPFAFIKRRAWRIYSAYLPVALLMAIVIAGSMRPSAFEGMSIWKTALLWPAAASERALDVSWSLTYEMIFYIAMSISLLFGKRNHLIPVMVVLGASGFILSSFGIKIESLMGRYLTSPFLLEFATGCLVSIAATKFKTDKAFPFLIVGVALLAAGSFYCISNNYVPGNVTGEMARFVLFGLPAAVLVYGCSQVEVHSSLALTLRKLGDASYAIYLLHMPTLIIIWHALPVVFDIRYFFKNLEIGAAVILVLTIALSLAYYKYVEQALLKVKFQARTPVQAHS
ncbi:acyltransferase family protein [Pseudomonas aeruginosa]